MVMCRMRSLGCTSCTGAIRSEADTSAENHRGNDAAFRRSERENRVIDHDQDGSMELKKREGYFLSGRGREAGRSDVSTLDRRAAWTMASPR